MPPTRSPVRWGILGAGRIATSFAADLRAAGHTITAVGARSTESAQAFAARFDVPHAHTGYEALVADTSVDAVYIATPQSFHEEHALLAFAAGKAALIEKSFSIDAASARRIVDAARSARVFAMEAMWSRFLPTMVEVRRMIGAGDIGEVRSVSSGHFQAIRPEPGSRHLDPALGGGALLDLGVYGISFAVGLLGRPERVEVIPQMLPGGIDGSAAVLMGHGESYSSTQFSMLHAGPSGASVVGADGYIELDPFFFTWTGLSRHSGTRPSQLLERIDGGPVVRALNFQAAEVERCLEEGQLESPVVPLDESVMVMETIDRIRQQMTASPREGISRVR